MRPHRWQCGDGECGEVAWLEEGPSGVGFVAGGSVACPECGHWMAYCGTEPTYEELLARAESAEREVASRGLSPDAAEKRHDTVPRDLDPPRVSEVREVTNAEVEAAVDAMHEVAIAPRCSDWGERLTRPRLTVLAKAVLKARAFPCREEGAEDG